jgi:hypothetical protein
MANDSRRLMAERSETTGAKPLTEEDIADLPPEVIAQLSRPVREMAERVRTQQSIDFATCTPEAAIAYFARDGIDFETSVDLLIKAFARAGREADLAPYLEGVTNGQ